ncbi:hypothetical protein NQ015_06350 [Corynebacterium sp. 153RC1]|uniref:hypothetical protein n=1 Tax=unclassified Corynebacterium TaxID=2624378 RepID=UPI00211C9209|nr:MULTISPECIES: hypothetical protein [unclassified Corynebacterium]MCQ9353172.1 hypothetical protein [Corynebacterium sp. 209RC1]MCQ9353889.1 hypothetical protein [Corynebacterium sp. 1222RC1]MCQ9356920.1 hypothetical protein [Corynebacterium sp. 122RC1]MCQ9359748.1 hypothetical protein [Corynebacterium sp. 142RC1]MCQ9361388.1 hypothetical protein [Corynebacterium sp. 153RC1]
MSSGKSNPPSLQEISARLERALAQLAFTQRELGELRRELQVQEIQEQAVSQERSDVPRAAHSEAAAAHPIPTPTPRTGRYTPPSPEITRARVAASSSSGPRWWADDAKLARLLGAFGGVVTVLGLGFLVSLGVERGFVTTGMLVALALLLSAAVFGSTFWLHARKFRTPALASTWWTGLVGLLLSLQAAHAIVHWIGQDTLAVLSLLLGVVALVFAHLWRNRVLSIGTAIISTLQGMWLYGAQATADFTGRDQAAAAWYPLGIFAALLLLQTVLRYPQDLPVDGGQNGGDRDTPPHAGKFALASARPANGPDQALFGAYVSATLLLATIGWIAMFGDITALRGWTYCLFVAVLFALYTTAWRLPSTVAQGVASATLGSGGGAEPGAALTRLALLAPPRSGPKIWALLLVPFVALYPVFSNGPGLAVFLGVLLIGGWVAANGHPLLWVLAILPLVRALEFLPTWLDWLRPIALPLALACVTFTFLQPKYLKHAAWVLVAWCFAVVVVMDRFLQAVVGWSIDPLRNPFALLAGLSFLVIIAAIVSRMPVIRQLSDIWKISLGLLALSATAFAVVGIITPLGAMVLDGGISGPVASRGSTWTAFYAAHALTSVGWIGVATWALAKRRASLAVGTFLAVAGTVKLVFFDLAAISGVPRTVAFLVCGVLLLVTAIQRSRDDALRRPTSPSDTEVKPEAAATPEAEA